MVHDYAVIRIDSPPKWGWNVDRWCETPSQAIKLAEKWNAEQTGRVYRAVQTAPGGKWESLTGEGLYV